MWYSLLHNIYRHQHKCCHQVLIIFYKCICTCYNINCLFCVGFIRNYFVHISTKVRGFPRYIIARVEAAIPWQGSNSKLLNFPQGNTAVSLHYLFSTSVCRNWALVTQAFCFKCLLWKGTTAMTSLWHRSSVCRSHYTTVFTCLVGLTIMENRNCHNQT